LMDGMCWMGWGREDDDGDDGLKQAF